METHMKRKIPIREAPIKNERFVVASQVTHFAAVHAKSVLNAIKAANITAVIYEAISNGPQCSCGFLNKTESLLDDEGHLTPSSITQLTSHFSADDLLLEDNYITPQETQTLDLLQLDAFTQNRCGICYGVGYKGGYNLSQGFRYVLDYRDVDQTDFDVERTQPYHLTNGTYATFKVSIPDYPGQTVTKLNVWNNDKILDEADYQLTDLTYGAFNNLTVSLTKDFTHIEIELSYGTTYIDMPQVPQNFSINIASSDFVTTMHIPYNVKLTKHSIIHENRFGRCWQVRELNLT